MANDIEFKLGLKGRVAQAYRGVASKITNRNRQIRDSMKRAGAAAKKFATSLKGIAIAAGALLIFRKINSVMQESVKLFDIQVKAEKQLEVSLGRTSEALLTQASALQKVTLFGDEATIQAQALIGMMVKEEDQIKSIIPLVQDFATAKGMQLSVAADLVSKTLGSSTNAMSRYGIQVEGAVGSTERLESLTKGLEVAFKGSARAAAAAGSGPLVQLQNRIDDNKELLGKAFLPLIIQTSEELERMFSGGLKSDALEQRFKKIADVAGIVVGAISDTLNTIWALFQFSAALYDTFIGAVLDRLSWMVKHVRVIAEKIPQRFVPDGWVEGIKSAEDAIGDLGKAGLQAGKELFAEGIGSLKATGDAIAAWDKMGEKAAEIADKITKTTTTPTPKAGKKEGPGLFDQATAETDKFLSAQAQAGERHDKIVDKYIAGIQRENMAVATSIKAQIKLRKDQTAADEQQKLATIQTAQAGAAALAQAFPKMKELAIVSALVNTYASANAAYNAMAGIPVVGPALGGVAAAAAVVAGLANVAKIKSAATGADFITRGEQLIKVGDNPTGRERVQVTPIGSPNLNGPQGGGGVSIAGDVTIHVSSPDPTLAGQTVQERLYALSENNTELDALGING